MVHLALGQIRENMTMPKKKILQTLHWLPVKRVHFKIFITTYKCLYGDLLFINKSFQLLMSFSQILLQVPASRLKFYGDCALSVAGPSL